MPATRYLYVTRHAEAAADESALTEAGRRQAALLGERLAGVGLTAVRHGPSARAEETARIVCERVGGVSAEAAEEAGDYPPYLPRREELPAESADATVERLAGLSAEERAAGPALARAAEARFTGPAEGDEARHELVVTHAFLAAWLVRDALDAPAWRWIGLNHANTGLTVIRYSPGRPAALTLFNDLGHLPEELRRPGFPPELRA
ncbi:bifunctional RNase H/acid phosphatase [Streptomyces sp. ADI98-12]|uniref:histidine phosphatase family protein n=1 Tax=Streptomyces TaxID=1883 RepID=UPI000F551067|nr:histidine phosphatase family protein [Streptomyces sp. ADI98-12]RPK89395.1 bifunctional RNase H/acid phosphatase [Streptomyces sp. ADI98-12]